MNGTNPSRLALGVAAALAFAACGKSSDNSKPSTTATVGPAGATLSTGVATLTVPAGALAQPTQITVSEAEPRHAGRTLRVEIEPHGLALAALAPARLAVRFDDSNAKVKLVDDNGTLHSVEVEDRNHGEYKTPMDHLGEVEVELEHGLACTPACTTGQECDDGVCKPHVEHPEARSCSPVCETGQECDDGTCKTHSEVEPHDVGTTCVPSCASGLHCDNGVCHT